MRPVGLTFNANGVARLTSELSMVVKSVTLGVGEGLNLPASSSGWGELLVSNNSEYAAFRWTGSAVPYLTFATAGISDVDEGVGSGFVCFVDQGTYLQILNRETGSRDIQVVYHYKEA